MARHLAPFSWRQRMAEMVRRRSFGCVLPLGRHASTNGSKFVHCASDTIALSSFQKEQNARHHKQVKREQALARRPVASLGSGRVTDWTKRRQQGERSERNSIRDPAQQPREAPYKIVPNASRKQFLMRHLPQEIIRRKRDGARLD